MPRDPTIPGLDIELVRREVIAERLVVRGAGLLVVREVVRHDTERRRHRARRGRDATEWTAHLEVEPQPLEPEGGEQRLARHVAVGRADLQPPGSVGRLRTGDLGAAGDEPRHELGPDTLTSAVRHHRARDLYTALVRVGDAHDRPPRDDPPVEPPEPHVGRRIDVRQPELVLQIRPGQRLPRPVHRLDLGQRDHPGIQIPLGRARPPELHQTLFPHPSCEHATHRADQAESTNRLERQSVSMIVTFACPPPSHIVCMP